MIRGVPTTTLKTPHKAYYHFLPGRRAAAGGDGATVEVPGGRAGGSHLLPSGGTTRRFLVTGGQQAELGKQDKEEMDMKETEKSMGEK